MHKLGTLRKNILCKNTHFRHAKYSKWSCLPWTCYSLMGLFIGLSPRWTPLNLLFCSSPNIWLWKLIQNKHVWDGCSTVVQHVDVEIATGKTQKSLTNGFCCFSCFSTIYVSPVSRHIWTFGLMLDQVPSELSVAGVKRGMRSLPVKTVTSRRAGQVVVYRSIHLLGHHH